MIMIIILVVFHNECKFQQFQRVTTNANFSNFKGLHLNLPITYES